MPSILTLLRRLTLFLLGRLTGWEPEPLRLRQRGHGRAYAFLMPSGAMLPGLGGGDGTEDDDADDDDEDESDDGDDDESDDDKKDKSKKGSDDDGDGDDQDDDKTDEDEVDESELDPKVKAILKKNRDKAKAADKRARRAERELRKVKPATKKPAKKSTDDQRDADDEDDKKDDDTPDAGTVKLRTANLLTALADKGYSGKRAKALSKLLDVDYDDNDEPEDLDDAIDEAKDTYGAQIVARKKPKPSKTDGGDGGDDGEKPSLTADELKMAKSMGMTPAEYANYKSPQPKLPAKKKTD